ncbi:ATP-binding cassette domain-containing protein [bacterium]|nr:ATP-binding cassette domain-containing protein [bacterium]
MSVYIQCNSLTKTISAKELFSNLTFTISEGDRIGLIGLNGCGKSTLVRMLTGEESVDGGEIIRKKGLVVGYVPQSSVFEDVSPKEVLITAMGKGVLEHDRERLAMRQLEKLGFTGEEESAAKLSGGWKKRLSIASELVKNPDVLLLDEPTNHLDLEGIVWLEKFLAAEGITYLLISHDRYFLEHATNRIMEIDKIYPEGVFSIKASYKEFLVQKERFIKGQLEQERSIAGKVRKETAWLRAGLKARTTKAQSRIDEAHDMMDRYAAVKKRNRQVHSKIDFEATGRETRKLMVIKNASKSLGEKKLFENLDITFSPGTRLGLLGPNGCGKTTLLKMLAGEMESDTGTIKRAENLQVVYFDQHRERLPLDITLKEALSPNKEYVEFRGSKIHVRAWAKRFLFEPELLPVPISTLSGGERARITIAHLMCKKADVLLLDEPTNDLDIPTLETLEESLLDFPGAIVLITHDRCMMDRVWH